VCNIQQRNSRLIFAFVEIYAKKLKVYQLSPVSPMRPEFLDRGPVEAIGHGSKTGWICEDSFMEWFSHFLHHVRPNARPHPTLLLADGHASHTNNLQLIERARQNNVTLLIFPSHCTHKLQAATYLMLLLGLHMMDELLLLNMMYKNHVSKFSPIFLKR